MRFWLKASVWIALFSGLCRAAPAQAGSHGRTALKSEGSVAETDDRVGAWLNMIDRAEGAWIAQTDFTALPDGATVRQDSEKWCGIFLKPEVNPHAANPAAALAIHHATADTADILRYDYGLTKMRLRLYETVDFVLLRIEEGGEDILKVSPDKRRDAIAAMAGLLLNPPPAAKAGRPEATWSFEFSGIIEDGSRFSTDASQEPVVMPSWASRVDGGIFAQHLYFVCFKKRQSGDGRLIMLNSHHWFDGRAWAPYQNPKGR
jgi:hypothetical protein